MFSDVRVQFWPFKMRILLPFYPGMSGGGILTFVLLVGVILFPQASADDLRKLYSQGNLRTVQQKNQFEQSDFQNFPPFLEEFIQGSPLAEASNQDVENNQLVFQAAAEQKGNDLKAGDSGLSKKQWYIIGGAVIIVLLIILATIILCMCNKERKKKKRQRAIAKAIHEVHPSIPVGQLNVDNPRIASSIPDGTVVTAEINVADSVDFQETSEQNIVIIPKLQEIQPNITTFPSTIAASSDTKIDVPNKTEETAPIAGSAALTMAVVSNERPTDEFSGVIEGQLTNDPQLYKNGANQKMIYTDKDVILVTKLPRKRYDSDSGTSDNDPRRRDQYIKREHDRGYDSDQSRYGHDNVAYDHYSEPRIRDHYGIPRLESMPTDQRTAYINEERRSGHLHHSEIYSNDHYLQRRHEPPRRIEDQGRRDSDPRQYYPKYDYQYDDRYSHRPYARYETPAQINRKYKDPEDYSALTIKDSRFKDPFSRDVRRELGAVIANSSFSKNDHVKSVVAAPERRGSYTIYTSSKAPQQEHKEYRERQPIKTVSASASPENFPIPKPDYLPKDKEEPHIFSPSKKPPVVHHKPVATTVVKPREFKGPYGPDDLDEQNNPYTLARGKTQRPVIDKDIEK